MSGLGPHAWLRALLPRTMCRCELLSCGKLSCEKVCRGARRAFPSLARCRISEILQPSFGMALAKQASVTSRPLRTRLSCTTTIDLQLQAACRATAATPARPVPWAAIRRGATTPSASWCAWRAPVPSQPSATRRRRQRPAPVGLTFQLLLLRGSRARTHAFHHLQPSHCLGTQTCACFARASAITQPFPIPHRNSSQP